MIAISIVRLYLVIRGGWVYLDGAWYYNPTLAIQNCEMAATMLALSVPGLKPLFGNWLSSLNVKGPGRSTSPRGTSGFSGVLGGSKFSGLHGKSVKTMTNVSVVRGTISGAKWDERDRRGSMDGGSEAGLEPGPIGMGGAGPLNSREMGGIVMSRDFKVEVNKSDDSLLDEENGAVKMENMRGYHGR